MLGLSTVYLVSKRHRQTLRDLQIFTLSPYYDSSQHWKGLQSFCYTSMEIWENRSAYVFMMVHWNRATLRHLRLGRNTEAVNVYDGAQGSTGDNNFTYDRLQWCLNTPTVGEKSSYQLSLFCLHFIAITLPPENPPLSILKLELLQSLCFESCVGTQDILSSLALIQGFTLKRFSLREEGATSQACTILETFLASFSGLEHLCVLLDQAEGMPDVSCFVYTHGGTLKTLVWEGRTRHRQSLYEDWSMPLNDPNRQPDSLSTICDECKRLEGIGFAIRWKTMAEYNPELVREPSF